MVRGEDSLLPKVSLKLRGDKMRFLASLLNENPIRSKNLEGSGKEWRGRFVRPLSAVILAKTTSRGSNNALKLRYSPFADVKKSSPNSSLKNIRFNDITVILMG